MPRKNVLVFDFGGGTLDLSLIELTKNDDEIIPKVLAIGGDEELGGNNIDFLFTKIILDYLKIKNPTDDFIDEVNDISCKFSVCCEFSKIVLILCNLNAEHFEYRDNESVVTVTS